MLGLEAFAALLASYTGARIGTQVLLRLQQAVPSKAVSPAFALFVDKVSLIRREARLAGRQAREPQGNRSVFVS